jgi:hypothetical protein
MDGLEMASGPRKDVGRRRERYPSAAGTRTKPRAWPWRPREAFACVCCVDALGGAAWWLAGGQPSAWHVSAVCTVSLRLAAGMGGVARKLPKLAHAAESPSPCHVVATIGCTPICHVCRVHKPLFSVFDWVGSSRQRVRPSLDVCSGSPAVLGLV